jgi:hypothetical protein
MGNCLPPFFLKKEDYLVRYEKNFFKSKEIFKGFRAWGNHWSGG